MTNSAVVALEAARVDAVRDVVSAEKALADAVKAVEFAETILASRVVAEMEMTSALNVLKSVYSCEDA